ncbi:hypothetical protein [Salinibacterium sp. ZJ70]|uniref:hypothetical protein n=1 Tax=Salinibacterium sp. ZJ70 TaxID=2708084 RepID=UPI00141F442C|nr:hypothetical protein [Salinibacterium sp. ZJ70]
MPTSPVTTARSRSRKRLAAIAAAGTVLAAGVTIPSLAAWTDIEWIAGGVTNNGTGPENPGDPGDGVSTATFEVVQRAVETHAFGDYETRNGADVISFGDAARALTPGDTVYAWVQLKTVDNSLGGTLALEPDNADAAATEIEEALQYGARIVPAIADCTATGYNAAGSELLQASGTSILGPATSADFSLAADGADTKTVCIELALPASADQDLQGQSFVPYWKFTATSVAP